MALIPFRSGRVDDAATLAYAATITPDGTTGSRFNVTATGNITTLNGPTSPPSDPYLAEFAILASGGTRTVTVASAVRISTGVTRGPYSVPSGQVLFLLMRYSALIAAYTLVAATISAT